MSGILPAWRYKKRLVQTSKSDKSNNPNSKQVGESAARGEVRTERSLNIYDSHTTPRYAGYAQSAYANSIAQQISKKERKIQNVSSVLLIAVSFMREEFESVRSTKKEIGTHNGVPISFLVTRGRIELPLPP